MTDSTFSDINIDVEVTHDLSLDYLENLITTEDIASLYTGISYNPANLSLDQFLSVLRELMETDQEDKVHKVILIDDYTKENIFQDPRNPKNEILGVVTCSVRSQKPGAFHQTNHPSRSGGTREIRPSLRAIVKNDVNDKSTWSYCFGQRFDNEICFTIHARSNKEANDIVIWFQKLLAVHKKFFALKGIIRYDFIEREADNVVKEGDSVIYIRPLCYYLTTEETFVTTEYVLQKIKLKLKTT